MGAGEGTSEGTIVNYGKGTRKEIIVRGLIETSGE